MVLLQTNTSLSDLVICKRIKIKLVVFWKSGDRPGIWESRNPGKEFLSLFESAVKANPDPCVLLCFVMRVGFIMARGQLTGCRISNLSFLTTRLSEEWSDFPH